MTELIRAVVVDDEPDARELLMSRLGSEPDIDVVAVCSSGAEGLAACKKHRPQLLFLDIQMSQMSGFDVLKSLDPQLMPYVIFVTAYDRYAVRAFEFAALDYLLKPFTKERFAKALERARHNLHSSAGSSNLPGTSDLIAWWETMQQQSSLDEEGADNSTLTRIVIRESRPYRVIDVDQIDMIRASDHYSSIHAGGKIHFYGQSLSKLEERLNGSIFVRIHKSTIVNLKAVRRVNVGRFGTLDLLLRNDCTARVSRGRRSLFELAMLRLAEQSNKI